jgi:hypothetical protein
MSDPGGCPTLAGVSTAQRVAFDSAAATGDAGVCGPLSRTSALAPPKPTRGPLVRRVAGASLRGCDLGHDGVDVHAASAPGGLSATAATGWTTHVVLLWLALNYWLAVSCKDPGGHCPGMWPQVLPPAHDLRRVGGAFC